jgi:ABC-type multidrug transport system ATPase subunit
MASVAGTSIVEARSVTREFHVGGNLVRALRGVDLSIVPGELVALRGRSGSGKTALLNILTGLDNPTAGQVQVLGRNLVDLDEASRARFRREHIGCCSRTRTSSHRSRRRRMWRFRCAWGVCPPKSACSGHGRRWSWWG